MDQSISKQEVKRIVTYCRENLNLSNNLIGDEYGYNSLPLCIIDAIFSIGVTYTSTRNTVKRFIQYFDFKTPISITDFLNIHEKHSIQFMAESIYKNRQRTSARNGILKAEAVFWVAQLLSDYAVNSVEDMDKVINKPDFEKKFKQIPGQTSGISLRYLYMLTGIETQIKPDRMIIRFITNILERPVKVDECHPLLTETCNSLKSEFPDLTPRKLDNVIWQYQKSM